MWASISVVLDICEECDSIGNWSEGCPCCDQKDEKSRVRSEVKKSRAVQPRGFRDELRCPYKGCRAVELACGRGQANVLNKMVANKERVALHFASVPPELRSNMLQDWESARARLWSSFVCISFFIGGW